MWNKHWLGLHRNDCLRDHVHSSAMRHLPLFVRFWQYSLSRAHTGLHRIQRQRRLFWPASVMAFCATISKSSMLFDYHLHPRPSASALFLIAFCCDVLCCHLGRSIIIISTTFTLSCFFFHLHCLTNICCTGNYNITSDSVWYVKGFCAECSASSCESQCVGTRIIDAHDRL